MVELVGGDNAPGVKEGGVLEQITREVTIEALPTDIPDSLHYDVSEMVIGDTRDARGDHGAGGRQARSTIPRP